MKASIRHGPHCSRLALLLSLAIAPGLGAQEEPISWARGAPGPDFAGPASPPSVAAGSKVLAAPALMLARVYEGGLDLSDYWVSEKLDGVRATWDGARLISRGGILIRAPDWFVRDFPHEPLDGELWIERGAFERVSGAVRRQQPDPRDWAAIRYMVFDLPGHPGVFRERLEGLRKTVERSANPHLAVVDQAKVDDHRELMRRLASIERRGGEGLMLHRDDASYTSGRTSALLKVKSYRDAEAKVIAHIPGRGRLIGMMGSVLVEDEGGHRFRIGTGFTDAERRDPPPIGGMITFKYQGYTGQGIPRFASFLRRADGRGERW